MVSKHTITTDASGTYVAIEDGFYTILENKPREQFMVVKDGEGNTGKFNVVSVRNDAHIIVPEREFYDKMKGPIIFCFFSRPHSSNAQIV